MVEIFGKQDDYQFKEWMRNNQNGFYLNKRNANEMMLHKVGCFHLGNGEGMKSTANLKIAADSVKQLFEWATENNKKVTSCHTKDCTNAFTS